MELALGMVACPRSDVKLTAAISNLRHGGFAMPVHIFAEPGLRRIRCNNIVWHRNASQLGGFGNWLQCARWLLGHYPNASHIMIVEDDVDYCRNARTIVEAGPADFAVVSLYLAKRYAGRHQKESGWVQHNYGTKTFGLLAVIFQRQVLQAFVADQPVQVLAKPKGRTRAFSHDSALFGWLAQHGHATLCFSHRPSLADHIGHRSNLGHRDGPHRRGLEFNRDY